jgi:hypothetical protein
MAAGAAIVVASHLYWYVTERGGEVPARTLPGKMVSGNGSDFVPQLRGVRLCRVAIVLRFRYHEFARPSN